MSDDEYGFCEDCGHDLSDRSSHYHCNFCGELCSMMGHWDERAGGFTCQKVSSPL
ncbi:MAG: hypothetical protein JWO67_6489 [Streptosporangiaceae bacterium]|nr:hypothetical protein [Streptosporangiaceae bacterium]